MKKLFYFYTVLLISISLIACGAKISNKANTNASVNNKLTYTKEFTYLPSYNGIQSSEYTPASTKSTFATAKYTIKNTTEVYVFPNYESILKSDGWAITQEQKYYSISAKKDTHIANILIQKSGKDVMLVVTSK